MNLVDARILSIVLGDADLSFTVTPLLEHALW